MFAKEMNVHGVTIVRLTVIRTLKSKTLIPGPKNGHMHFLLGHYSQDPKKGCVQFS